MENKLIPFNFNEAKAGKRIIYRKGDTPLAWRFFENEKGIGSFVATTSEQGRHWHNVNTGRVESAGHTGESPYDLFMAPNPRTKRCGWMNVYDHQYLPMVATGRIYKTKNDADADAREGRVDCCFVEWEGG